MSRKFIFRAIVATPLCLILVLIEGLGHTAHDAMMEDLSYGYC